jgi:hypothetical protein
METDRAFEQLRAETGSPLPVRIPLGLFAIAINLTFLIWGWDNWPPIRVVAVAVTAVPAWLLAMYSMLRFSLKKGWFFGWKRPILYQRWGWWLWIWPTPDEPAWRKTFAIVVLTCAVLSYVVGAVRWGFFPAPTT